MRCNKTLHSLSISLTDAPLPPVLPFVFASRRVGKFDMAVLGTFGTFRTFR